jgi:hypothetical protein
MTRHNHLGARAYCWRHCICLLFAAPIVVPHQLTHPPATQPNLSLHFLAATNLGPLYTRARVKSLNVQFGGKGGGVHNWG